MTTSQLLTDSTTPMMSVGEFRKLTGKATAHLSDEQVREAIQELVFIADLYFRSNPSSSEKTDENTK